MWGRSMPRRPARSCDRRTLRAGAALTAVLAISVTFPTLPGTAPALASGTVPAYDHVFWVVDGGQPSSAVIGTASYLTALADANTLATAYTAVDPSSLADRLALTAGQTGGVVADCLPADCPQGGDNLATRIEASGRTWAAYAESMPAPCSTAPATDFAPERVPFLYYTALAGECASHVVPYTQLQSDLSSAATTPSFAWISPNLSHDMSSSVTQGDSWLLANLPAIFASPAWRTQHSLLVVLLDQPGAGNTVDRPVPAVIVASDVTVRSGYASAVAYNHYSLLSTLEASWGLPSLTTNDGGAAPMSDVFVPPPTPEPSSSPPSTWSAPPGPSASPTATSHSSATSSPSATQAPTTKSSAGVAAGLVALAGTTAGSNEFTVAAPVVDVVDLTYVGPTTIASGGVASLPVLQFTATSLATSSVTSDPSFSLQSPCTTQNGMSIAQLTTAPSGGSVSFSGAVTLDVTSIDFTYLGTAYSFTAAAPPASFGPVPAGQLTAVSMVAGSISAGSTSLPGGQTVAFFQC